MEKKAIIKTGFCVSYDWRLLANSLPPVYDHSDIICLALDNERKSWSGNIYEFNEKEFYELIHRIDTQNKIIIYEDKFSLPQLNARENCNRHRMLLAERMGKGGWHVQIDSDEYFMNFKGFRDFLTELNPHPSGKEKPFNVHVFLYDLFKKLDDGYLYIYAKDKRPFSAPFATTKPEYLRARHNGHFNKISPFYVVHETWARGEDELRFKLSNWGHSSEELKKAEVRESFINLWKAVDKYNFKYIKDFHFLISHGWEGLEYVPGQTINEFIQNFKPDFRIQRWYLNMVNSRAYGRFNFFWHKAKELLKKNPN